MTTGYHTDDPPEIERADQRLDLERALAALAPVLRETVLLWLAGYEPTEIAVLHGLGASGVRKRLHRALAQLAARLGL